MALQTGGRVIRKLSLFLCWYLSAVYSYQIPDVQIQAFKPKGFRASIPDAPNVSLFVFQGKVNQPIANTDYGSLVGEVTQASNGRWVFEDINTQLKVGDVINYYVFVSVNGAGYTKDDLSFTVRALEDLTDQPIILPSPSPATPAPAVTDNPLVTPAANDECRPTATVVRGGSACAGQTIFEDHFDTLREDVWQIEQYIPMEHPEYPFVSYQRGTVSVSDGNLRIAPRPQQNMPGYSNESILTGDLNLFNGCTGSANECSTRASGASILPPVASGRVTSKGLAFTYGIVHIRAKLPTGDWLYPEILLEPFRKKYGTMFASGVVNIARARGNKELHLGITAAGNNVLYGGAIMDFNCRQYLISEKKMDSGRWGDGFHVYTVKWTPEKITLLVDNQEWARIEPALSGLQGRFPPSCRDLPRPFLSMGSKMAPFDDHFFITLGVAAGGITEFRDDLYTQDFKAKPWRNQARKASLNFWQHMDSWYQTWVNPELLVDYIKIVAL